MTQALEPTFRELEQREAHDLLARNHVGRIAYSFRDRVDIEPISYVYADGAIYMRTELGSKLATLAHAPWVAFEVDEVEGPFDWRSIVTHGTVYVLHETGTPTERATYRLALQRLREIMPSALNDDDPVPGRRILLRLQPAVITGRAASSGTTDR
jgi:nitroimidazol reductase NimA-like FMN-containing flavoprotein (pyridoxamine 5'-phosphate oxidase superfamily)